MVVGRRLSQRKAKHNQVSRCPRCALRLWAGGIPGTGKDGDEARHCGERPSFVARFRVSFWKKMAASLGSAAPPAWQGARDARAYAVGDIHGRLDLLDELIVRIEDDLERKPVPRAFVVFLGDLIDRGPDSRGVVERLMTWRPTVARPVFLMGNHEEILLRVLAGEEEVLASWMQFGGAECVASYGVDPASLARLDEKEAASLLRRHVPAAHIAFIEEFGDTFRFGDYLFVHAGIRPGVPVESQAQRDLRWIRAPFLNDAKSHGFMVVHGHTIVDSVEERSNRIAIDTGAVYSGVLTALVVQGGERRYLATGREDCEKGYQALGPSGDGDSGSASLLRVQLAP
jgi:serine/threonine protein phosphatase 1